MPNTNLSEYQLLYWIHQCIQVHNCPHRSGTHGSNIHNSLCYHLEIQQQNVNWSGSHTQTSQTFQLISLVLLNNSICSQAPLELSKVISDYARAFSCAPESTPSEGGAFRMLRYLTDRIVKWSGSWDLCAGLRETWCCIITAVVS